MRSGLVGKRLPVARCWLLVTGSDKPCTSLYQGVALSAPLKADNQQLATSNGFVLAVHETKLLELVAKGVAADVE